MNQSGHKAHIDGITSLTVTGIPAIGEPMVTAKPWNRSNSPNALVSFSRPSSSTVITERSVANEAVGCEEVSIKDCSIRQHMQWAHLPTENPKIEP